MPHGHGGPNVTMKPSAQTNQGVAAPALVNGTDKLNSTAASARPFPTPADIPKAAAAVNANPYFRKQGY